MVLPDLQSTLASLALVFSWDLHALLVELMQAASARTWARSASWPTATSCGNILA